MRDQEIIGLWEAYQQVHAQPQEEVEQLDEISRSMGRRAKEYRRKQEQDAHMERVRQHQHNMENDPEYRERHERLRTVHSRRANGEGGEDRKESFDLFDYLLEYLVAEGYADTNKAALAIMANMSEEWRQSIIEAVDEFHPGHPKYKGPSQDPLSRLNRTIGKGLRFVTGQRTAEVRAKQGGVPGNVFVKQSGPFSTKNVPVPGSFMSDTELIRRGLGTKPMGPIGE